MAFPAYGTAVPSLAAWQMQYETLVLGLPGPFGITEIDGLDLPPVQTSDMQRARDHGELIGLDLLGGRDITITGDYVEDGSLSMAQTGQEIASSASNYTQGGTTEAPLWFAFPGLPTLCAMARVRKRNVNVDLAYTMGLAQWQLQFHATDPRLWGTTVRSTATNVGGPAPGVGVTIDYTGNFDCRPIVTMTGPLTNPGATILGGTGWTIQTNLTLTAGQWIQADLDLHSVLYSDGTHVYWYRSAVTSASTWPSYTNGIPGLLYASQPITIECYSSDASATTGSILQVDWCPAYMI
jgi:hypothetical protein